MAASEPSARARAWQQTDQFKEILYKCYIKSADMLIRACMDDCLPAPNISKTFGLWGEHEKTLYSCMQTAIVHKGVRHKELEEARNAGTLNELILEKYPDIAQSPYGRAAKACGGFKAPDGRSIDQMYAWANEDAA